MSTAARTVGSKGSSGTEDVHQIELEIEATREELDRTLDALQARLSPRLRLQAAVRNARERGSRLADRSAELTRGAVELVRREPVPFAAAAVGVLAIIAVGIVIRRR